MKEQMFDVSAIIGCGVYALCYNEEVVYVGASTQMLQRITAHKTLWLRKVRGKRMPMNGPRTHAKAVRFNRVLVLPCLHSDLYQLELKVIAALDPIENIRGVTTKGGANLLAKLGFNIVPMVSKAPEGFVRRI